MKYILRACVVRNGFENYIQKLVAACKKYKIDEVMLCEDNAYIGAIAQPLSEHKISAEYCKKAVEIFKENKISCSFYLKSLVGHITSESFALPYVKFVGIDGTVSKNECCLADERFAEYAARVFLLYADCGFSKMFLDDDFRSVNHCNGRNGCVCKLHVKKTSDLLGRKITRKNLAVALSGNGSEDIRECFLKANYESQLFFLKKIEERVHKKHSEIRLGLMCSGIGSDERQGRDMYALLKTFAGKHRPYLRPPGGPYFDTFPSDYLFGYENKKQYEAYLDGEADFISEVDIYSPRNIYTKSLAFIDLQMRLHALAGYAEASLNVIDHFGTDPEIDNEYLALLAKNKSVYEKIRKSVAGKKAEGIMFGIRRSYSSKMHGYNEDFPNYNNYAKLFMRLGLPVGYENGVVNFLAGDCVRKKSDEDLLKLLSGTLFMDFSAAKALQERGFEKYTGVWLQEKIQTPCYEVFSDPEFHGKYTNVRFPVNVGNVYKEQNVYRVEKSEKAIAITEIVNAELKKISDGATLFRNELGGFAVVFPNDVNNDSFLYKGRQKELYSVLEKVGVNLKIDVCGSVNVVPFVFTGEEETVYYLYNCSFDKKTIEVKTNGEKILATLAPLELKKI